MSRNMHCEEIEKLLYLKEDELSREEYAALQDHLQECEDCTRQYEEISQFMHRAEFDNLIIDSRFLAARVIDQYKKHENKKSEKRINPVRRQLVKVLSIASVFFFIIFSIEQLNTVTKISDLEKKLAIINGTKVEPKGQVLVLNHFYDMDDLKQIINPDIDVQADLGSVFLNAKSTKLNLRLYNSGNKILFHELVQSGPFGKVILNGEFYGNSRLLNILFEKNKPRS